MKKMLIAFWGTPQVGTYLRNNPFLDYYHEDTEVNIEKILNNYKIIFFDYEFEILWCTWSHINLDEQKIPIKYKLQFEEPSNWEEYLNSINFPYVAQIKGHPVYQFIRPGYYTQFFCKYSIADFISKNNLQYDSIIVSRTDIFHIPKNDFVFNLNEDIIYVPEIYWGSRGIGLNDHVLIGKFDLVSNTLKFENFEQVCGIIGNSYNAEHGNEQILRRLNTKIVEYPCEKYCRIPDHMV